MRSESVTSSRFSILWHKIFILRKHPEKVLEYKDTLNIDVCDPKRNKQEI